MLLLVLIRIDVVDREVHKKAKATQKQAVSRFLLLRSYAVELTSCFSRVRSEKERRIRIELYRS